MELKQEEEQSPSEARTSKAQIDERDCEFGDHNCGEPLLAQRLLIDFTPDEELDLDSEYNQNKCRAFWDFIKSKPELQHLMAVPEAIEYGESFTLSEYQQSEPSPTPEPVDRTAVSTLELVQKEGQMAPAFQGMMPQSHCSLGSREYPEPIIGINKSKKKPHVCAGKPSSEICGRASRFDGRSAALAAAPRWKSLPAHAQSDPVAVDLCKNINKWDAEHPKSMEPPGHPSNLCTARRKP